MSWRRTASTSITFILAVCTRPMCAARHLLLHAGIRKLLRNFRSFSIIVASWARIPSARWRTCNWARAFVLSGDPIKAKAAYQDFLTLWKDADSDIPILVQAKTEYARLQ